MRYALLVPITLPLLGAGVLLLVRRSLWAQRCVGVATLVAALGASIAVLVRVDAQGPRATQVGGWPAPFGITIAADLFSALMLVIAEITLLVVLAYAIGQQHTDENPGFHPVYQVLAAGVAASFLAGDLFYLFVAFEITLSASYVLITLTSNRDQVRTGMTYVSLNLLGSTLFLAGVGLVYAATGTVNLAQLVDRMADLPPGIATALALLLLVAFGVKAAVFPLFFWLPDSYPTAPSPVTAVFAGLLTKVGVYAMFRTETFLMPGDGASTLLLVVAALTMIVGVLGAIAQDDMKRILSFHIVSQIGYMVMGLAFGSVAGVAAGIYFIIHQIPVKTALFLASGVVEHMAGTASLQRISGFARRLPVVGALFLLAALSLAGIPPLSGFVGKLGLVEAGLSQAQWWVVGVSLLASLLTLFSMTKIWNGVFWGPPDPLPAERDGGGASGATLTTVRLRGPGLMIAATTVLVAVTLAIAVFARPIYDASTRAAEELVDPRPYVTEVLGER